MRSKFFILLMIIGLISCQEEVQKPAAFALLGKERTGLDFNNLLAPNLDLNIFNYMYFYNGGGIGSADLNNDGLIDLVFSANQQANKIYINKGGLKFEDITTLSGIQHNPNGWSTGVSLIDINADGLMDIYFNEVGSFENIVSRNYLYVCKEINEEGIPIYEEAAKSYGLDLIGFSTQTAFLDYDLDGDLDLYQMNHSLHANGTFGQRFTFKGKSHPLSGDRFFENKNGKFEDVTKQTGIYNSVIGYGLGIATGDINMDGYPDIYIGNDFHENDYLYINKKDGTFKEELTSQMMHTSRFSMGVDMADINNDGHSEIISLDMLPYDPYILKKSEGEDDFPTFRFKLSYGYNHQYAKNNLQLNNKNGSFSEIAMYADVFATDWSWAPLLFDFDNNGQKDLFITNGIPKRMNDIDYINHVINDDIQWRIKTKNIEDGDLEIINQLPEIKLPNKFYLNSDSLRFSSVHISNDKNSYSNGAIYADLDNDGDLDVVSNNINQEVFLYENLQSSSNDYIKVDLKGPAQNPNAIGAKLLIEKGAEQIIIENYPVRGFQSSMQGPIHAGIGNREDVTSVKLIWPDNSFQEIALTESLNYELIYKEGLPAFNYNQLGNAASNMNLLEEISEDLQINFTHEENPFVEFDREPLIPHAVSAEGPALAVGDFNGDDLEDFFVGSSKRTKAALYTQNAQGKFELHPSNAILQDSVYEDVDAKFVDLDKDQDVDLIVASGGNEYYNNSPYQQSRIYRNDGAGNFERQPSILDSIFLTASCVELADFNGDGYPDIFLGARSVVWSYGATPNSYLLQNDGAGNFIDVTKEKALALHDIGMIKSAQWIDMDQDGDQDLIVAVEWDGIYAFINNGDAFEKKVLSNRKAWWAKIHCDDFDGDGDVDIFAGNLGLNNRLKVSDDTPVKLYFNDFDDNGKKEQILTYYIDGSETVFATKTELEKQLPFLKKKFLLAKDFAEAEISELLPSKKLKKAEVLEANYFQSCFLFNDGHLQFTEEALPYQAQFSSINSLSMMDVNNDTKTDILIGGNFYENNIEMSRYDASYGAVLINQGAGTYDYAPLNGHQLKGQIRQLEQIKIKNENVILVGRNHDSLEAIKLKNEIQ